MLDRKIIDLYTLRGKNGEIGLELEVEGTNLPGGPFQYWIIHNDGSLRGEAFEYVLTAPVAAKAIPAALAELDEAFKKAHSTFNLSIRTSVHVHLNVQKMYLQEVYNLFSLYAILDNSMVEYSGPDRIGNLFCLRLVDAEYLPITVVRGLKNKTYLHGLTNDHIRYASINLMSLQNYGSVEFRSFRGCVDMAEVAKWVEVVYSLKAAAYRYNDPREIIQDFNNSGPDAFLNKNVPAFFAETVKTFRGYKTQLERGANYAFEIAYAIPEWLNMEDVRKRPVKPRNKPGVAEDNDPRFVNEPDWFVEEFLQYERNDGTVISRLSPSFENVSRYIRERHEEQEERQARTIREQGIRNMQVPPMRPAEPVDPLDFERLQYVRQHTGIADGWRVLTNLRIFNDIYATYFDMYFSFPIRLRRGNDQRRMLTERDFRNEIARIDARNVREALNNPPPIARPVRAVEAAVNAINGLDWANMPMPQAIRPIGAPIQRLPHEDDGLAELNEALDEIDEEENQF